MQLVDTLLADGCSNGAAAAIFKQKKSPKVVIRFMKVTLQRCLPEANMEAHSLDA